MKHVPVIPFVQIGAKNEGLANSPVELHRVSQQELPEAFQWYEDRSPDLCVSFIEAVNERFFELSKSPERFQKRKASFREALIKTFPYILIYEFLPKENVVFVSYVLHAKRNPKLKYGRKR